MLPSRNNSFTDEPSSSNITGIVLRFAAMQFREVVPDLVEQLQEEGQQEMETKSTFRTINVSRYIVLVLSIRWLASKSTGLKF